MSTAAHQAAMRRGADGHRHAIMLRFEDDGSTVLYVLHTGQPADLARRLQRLAATLVEHPSAAPQLVGAVGDTAATESGRRT